MLYTNRDVLVTLDLSPKLDRGVGVSSGDRIRDEAWAHWTNRMSASSPKLGRRVGFQANAPQYLAAGSDDALRGRPFVPDLLHGHSERHVAEGERVRLARKVAGPGV